ncbi:hypothetical protein RND81_05G208500 [Saponaria officinalis]|uniref:Bet v I/Major latex protein domain-containing protein n=1 Tax=Saponaria officinalis TaxID=3572 RepID=A0AAW1L1N1_SAPOF
MGVSTHTLADYPSSVAPARLFQAFCYDAQNFMPKAVPDFVKSVDVIQGVVVIPPASHIQGYSPTQEPQDENLEFNAPLGGIEPRTSSNFPEGRPFKYAKNRIDETTIEGDVLGENKECAVYEVKFEPTGYGCHYTMVVHYHTKGDYVIKEDDIAIGKQNIKKLFNAVEHYLTANPELYA